MAGFRWLGTWILYRHSSYAFISSPYIPTEGRATLPGERCVCVLGGGFLSKYPTLGIFCCTEGQSKDSLHPLRGREISLQILEKGMPTTGGCSRRLPWITEAGDSGVSAPLPIPSPLHPSRRTRHPPNPPSTHTHTQRDPACKAPAKPTALFKNLQLAPSDSTNGA